MERYNRVKKAKDPRCVVTGHVAENIGLTLVRFYVFYGCGVRRPSQIDVRVCGSQRLRLRTTAVMLTGLLVIRCTQARNKGSKLIPIQTFKPIIYQKDSTVCFGPVLTCLVHSAEHKHT